MTAAHSHSSEDARRLAKQRLPWMIFDYIDGAAGAETGAARNRAALDALTLKAAGVDAIQVSSHGSRQLESAPAPIDVLPAMRNALGPDFPLFFDSGLRSGEDVLTVETSIAIAQTGMKRLADV